MNSRGKTIQKCLCARRKRSNQSGQAITEYILLLAIVVGLVAFFMHTITGSFDQTTALFGGKIEKQIRTGSAPATVWNK